MTQKDISAEPINKVWEEAIMKNLIIKHAIITPVCRENRGSNGAFEEAVQRLREQFYKSLEHYPDANFHLKLELERTINERTEG